MEKITHSFLVDKGAYWLKKQASNIKWRCPFVVKEFVCAGINEIPDIFGLRPGYHVLIEVKISRADFRKDFLKISRLDGVSKIGNYRFYLAPKELIKIKELPENWGLLEWDGKKIEVTYPAYHIPTDNYLTDHIYHSILRRLYKYQIFEFKKKKNENIV